jgi:hypothetical protein
MAVRPMLRNSLIPWLKPSSKGCSFLKVSSVTLSCGVAAALDYGPWTMN